MFYKRESRLSPARTHQSKRVGMSLSSVGVFPNKSSIKFQKILLNLNFFLFSGHFSFWSPFFVPPQPPTKRDRDTGVTGSQEKTLKKTLKIGVFS